MELKEAYGTVGAEAGEAEATFDHAKLDAFLREYVDDDGWVDYLGLKAVEPELDDYLTTVAAAPFDAWGRDEKLALLINAYNKPLGKRFGRKRLPTPLASFTCTRRGFSSTRQPTNSDLQNCTIGTATTSSRSSAARRNSPHATRRN